MINSIDSIEDINKIKETLSNRFGKVTDDMVIYMH